MGKPSRDKGKLGELEMVHVLRAAGWPDAERTSNGREQGLGDIANGPKDVYMEVRRREKLNVWASFEEASRKAPMGYLPLVAFRRSRSPWLTVVELDEMLPLLALREKALDGR